MKDLIARLVGMILRRTIRGAAIADREERVRSETTAPSRAPVLPGLRIMAGCPALRTRPVALPHVRVCAGVRVHAHLKQSFPSETRYVYTHARRRVARRDPLSGFDISPQHPLLQDQHSGGVRASFAGARVPRTSREGHSISFPTFHESR